MNHILGIDEAGRGPVIGPLVMAGVVVQEDVIPQLSSIGIKDSKLLTKEIRTGLYPKILELAKDYKIIILEPHIIDGAVQSTKLNLNWLEAHTTAEIINSIDSNATHTDTAIIDCPSTNIKAYKDYLYNLLKQKNLKLILEHNAERHMPVAAASILAKVTRDRIIEKIKTEIGIDFGSGYMADPLTKDFLEKHYETHSNLFRKSWASYTQTAAKKLQKKLGEF